MVLPIYRNHLLGPLPALFLGDDFIPYVFKAKNLGVTFSYNLNWGDHVSTICRKVYEALAGLRRLADVTPFAIRMRLVVALVIPFFIYCDCVYFALDSYSLRKLTMHVSGMSIAEGFLTIFLMSPNVCPLSIWLGLSWSVESGFGTRSHSQLGFPHHFSQGFRRIVRDFLGISY
jgi:hypothetical protein